MKRFFLCLAVALFALPAFAGDQFLTSRNSNCKIYNPPNLDPVINSTSFAEWSGACKNGYAMGHGTVTFNFNNGEQEQKYIYEGDMLDGKMSGKGVTIDTDGTRYEGEWKNGKLSGKVVVIDTDGTRYEGEWKNRKRNGYGAMIFSDGELLKGEWKDGLMNGDGVWIYSKNDTKMSYKGKFKNHKPNGYGIMTWKDGKRYEGQWKDDMRNGKGVTIWPDGDRYTCEWKDDEPIGTSPEAYKAIRDLAKQARGG